MTLPKDPIILLSFVNTQLRDNYSSLDQLCQNADMTKEELTDKLLSAGFEYNKALNQFR